MIVEGQELETNGRSKSQLCHLLLPRLSSSSVTGCFTLREQEESNEVTCALLLYCYRIEVKTFAINPGSIKDL